MMHPGRCVHFNPWLIGSGLNGDEPQSDTEPQSCKSAGKNIGKKVGIVVKVAFGISTRPRLFIFYFTKEVALSFNYNW